MRGGVRLGPWSLESSMAYARGRNRTTDQPLNSVDPLKGVLSTGFNPTHARWGAELVGTAVRRKTSVDTISGPLFIPPSYYTLDVLAHTMLFERLRLNFGVFNLADRKFWEWADVQGRPANDPAIDRYTRTGRHARLGAICRF